MQYQVNQNCCNSGLPASTSYCGCGSQYPIVPGQNPSLVTWDGQNFVVADGSSINPITLPSVQRVNSSDAQYVLGLNTREQLSLVPNIQNTQIYSNIAIVYAIALG